MISAINAPASAVVVVVAGGMDGRYAALRWCWRLLKAAMAEVNFPQFDEAIYSAHLERFIVRNFTLISLIPINTHIGNKEKKIVVKLHQ